MMRKLATFLRLKDYGGTWGLVIVMITWGYVAVAIEPTIPSADEIQQVTGKAVYHEASGRTVSNDYFAVNGLRLDFYLDGLGGSGGAGRFIDAVDLEKPVQVLYFNVQSRIGTNIRVIHAVIQDDYQIIPPALSYEERVRSYKANQEGYDYPTLFILMVTIIMWCMERFGVKQKSVNLKENKENQDGKT